MVYMTRIREWISEKEDCTPMHYVTCQWQRKKKSAPYFIYRLLSFVWFIEAIILSFIDVSFTMEYWPIYYTHWSFLLATVQSGMALILVSMNQADAFNTSGGRKQSRVCKAYELIHAAAATQAVGVTILFWAAVYNPKSGSPSIETIQVHAINSVAMLLDLCLVAFPVRIIAVLVPLSVSLLYLLFNYIYYAAGGRRYDGAVYIYEVLDWTKPGRTGIFSVIVAVLIIVLFFLIWFISLMRRYVHSRLAKKQKFKVSYSQQQIHISTIA